jgi:ankyrin repeat protein
VGRQTLSDGYLITKRQAKAKILMESGADPNLPDKESNTPLNLAKKHNYAGIVELLSKTDENLVFASKLGKQKN